MSHDDWTELLWRVATAAFSLFVLNGVVWITYLMWLWACGVPAP